MSVKTINSNKIRSGSSTTHTSSSTHSKKSTFLSLFSNLINSSNNSTIRSSRKLNTPDQDFEQYSERSTVSSAFHNRRLKKNSPMDHHFVDSNESQTPINNSSRIIRVAKCYDLDTNAIVYIRDTCEGEFMIDASLAQPATSYPAVPSQYYLSPHYLYDIKTLLENDFLFEVTNNSSNLQFELIMKRSTKMNRLPFINIYFTPNDQVLVRNQLTVIVYDVNRNKFFEYYLNDLLQLTKFYKFSKSINNDDLLSKYKAKLDWCMETIHEFKFDVKLRLLYLQNNPKSGYYLEQYLFRTYSRRNFRRRTANSASLPLTNVNSKNFENEEIHRNNNNEESQETGEQLNEDEKENKLRRIIKFATSSKHTQKQFKNNEDLSQVGVENKRKLSTTSTESKSNYSTVRNKLASIFQNSPERRIKEVEKSGKAPQKQFVTVIDVNTSMNSINDSSLNNSNTEDYYKKNKKIFKRPTLFNSFNKQSAYITSSAFDVNNNNDDSRPYFSSHLKINENNHEKRPHSSASINSAKESISQPNSLQKFLNIRKKTQMGKMSPASMDGYYTPINKSFEVTAI